MNLADDLRVQAEGPPQRAQFVGQLYTAQNASAGSLLVRGENASDLDANAWIEALGRVIADLELLNQNTEQGFLRIGERLSDFFGAVKLISSELTALAESQHELCASQALTHSLECSAQMSTQYSGFGGGLNSVLQEARRLKQTLSGFQKTVSTFHTLGLLTRIESTRLGRAGAEFGNLANDMKSVATDIQDRVESVLKIVDSLLPPIESAIQRIVAIEEGQSKNLPAVISRALASLSSLREIQDSAHAATIRLRARYQAISQAFNKLIVSIQFHDITRQQVEHVIEVLRRLCSESVGDGTNVRGQHGIAAVLKLQSLHLADAGEKFATSVASVARSLDDIQRHVMGMTEESRTLSGASGDEKNSFLLEMERGCTAILDGLTHRANAECDTQATSGVLVKTIGRMHESLKEIQAIEREMHLMAVNARICASHIGRSGDALSALAGSMQQQASETRERSKSLLKALDSMKDGAARLSGKEELDSGPDIQNGCMEEMRLAVAELHSSSERSFAQITQIHARGTRLGEDLSSTRETFTVGALFANAVSSAQQILKVIEEKIQSDSPPHEGTEAPPVLAEFATHYTMKAERDVHEGITRTLVEAVPMDVLGPLSECPPIESGELGDNVEFF
jgi:hypothetical protein